MRSFWTSAGEAGGRWAGGVWAKGEDVGLKDCEFVEGCAAPAVFGACGRGVKASARERVQAVWAVCADSGGWGLGTVGCTDGSKDPPLRFGGKAARGCGAKRLVRAVVPAERSWFV